MRKLWMTLGCMVSALATIAQVTDTMPFKKLDDVIVTGQFSPRSVKSSVYQVKVIRREQIEKLSPTKLQDVLMSELNIRFTQDLAVGGTNIMMLGMSGQNVKVLIDGVPMIGRQGTNNEISINQIDINTIERIEIVEGPMSVIYGADALAGVINIITKKSSTAKWSILAKLHEETIGKEYSLLSHGIHNPSLAFTTHYKSWDAGANLSYNYFGGWKDTAIDRELVWNKKDQLLAGGFIGYKGKKFNLRYRFDGLDELIQDPGNFVNDEKATGDTFAINKKYYSNRAMQQLQGSFTLKPSVVLQSALSYTNYNRRVHSEWLYKKSGEINLDPTPDAQSLVNFKGINFRSSVVYSINPKYALQPGIEINRETGAGERMHTGTNKLTDYAFFLSAELKPVEKWSIRPGFRLIKNSVYNAPPLVPSLNVKYNINTNLDIRAAYAHGFRAPSLRELYMNFFDINHRIIGNPNLKAEVSNTSNLSINYSKSIKKNISYNASIGGFYNQVKNMIDYAVSASSSDTFTLVNLFNSKTAGITLNGQAKYKNWNFGAGAAATGFFNIYSAQQKSLPEMQWGNEFNLNVGYNVPKLGLDANLFYKYTGTKPGYMQAGADFLPIKTDDYHWADFSINKTACKGLRLSAGVKNLFDVKRLRNSIASISVHTNNNVLSVGTGRSFFAGIQYQFSKN